MKLFGDKDQPRLPASQPTAKKASLMEEGLLCRVAWAARAVHKHLGPGFDRDIYLNALAAELQRLGLLFERDREYPVNYHGVPVGAFTADVVVEGRLLIFVLQNGILDEGELGALEARLRQANLTSGIFVDFSRDHIQMVRLDTEN